MNVAQWSPLESHRLIVRWIFGDANKQTTICSISGEVKQAHYTSYLTRSLIHKVKKAREQCNIPRSLIHDTRNT